MNTSRLRAILEAEYGLAVRALSVAPRQFVAETYFVDLENGERHFCKVVDKPLFVESIRAGLPVMAELQGLGYRYACYPVPAISGALHVEQQGQLIVLWTYIDAPQNYAYDLFTLGQRIAEIHALSTQLRSEVPHERYQFEHAQLFEQQFAFALKGGNSSPLHRDFQELMQSREKEIGKNYARLNALSGALDPGDYEMVLTHGDLGGNVLVKAPTEIYIVDWDENRMAPKERDLWMLQSERDFLEGYRSVRPGAEIDRAARDYSILVYYFYALLHYFREIIDGPSVEHRRTMLKDLEAFFDGWIKPHVDSLV